MSSTPPIVRLSQLDTFRLIATGRLAPPALSPLAADEQAIEDLARLESATNRRLVAERSGLPDLHPGELVFGFANFTLINAAFAHTRPGGNRFNDEARGAWYCAFDVETALYEIAYHLTRELENIGRFDNTTDYAELIADFVGPYHDLRGIEPRPACLSPDIAIGYPEGQALARQLRAHESDGIVYPSVRKRDGTCLVAFRPNLVQNLRQGQIWRLEWRGSRTPCFGHPP